MLRFFNIINGVITTIADDDKHDLNQLVAQADWIDAHEPTDEERELISSLLRIELPESEDVEEIETSARCFIDTAGIHVHSLFLSPTEGRHNTVTVACILQNKRLITIREGEVADFRLLRLRARKGQIRCEDVDSLLVTLLEQKVENHADTLEDIHRQLEKVSHDVLENDDADLEECISRLARLEDSNGKVRLCLMDTQRDISFLLRHLKSRNDHRETLSEISRDIEALMSHTTFLFDKINFLMDSTQGFIKQHTQGNLNVSNEESAITLSYRHQFAKQEMVEIIGRVWKWVFIGVGIGAGLHGFVPDGWIEAHLGAGQWWSVPASVLIGIPLYSNATGVIPIMESLLRNGLPIGTTLAFCMSTVAASVPEFVMLKQVMQWRLLGLLFGLLLTAFTVMGWIFNLPFWQF
ncbi:permease [Vibrio cholerae]|jgi:magnesium transporter|uniref:permease n=1 Tax=Vibrio cholerae TaxID=666 RepID=UPI0022718627|nr:permease [Vibrio cholerae]